MSPSQLQIKSNALQRLLKEKNLYKQELEECQQTIIQQQSQLASEPGNEELEYTLKSSIKIKDETARLLPTLNTKISEILQSLKDYLTANQDENTDAIKKLIDDATAELN